MTDTHEEAALAASLRRLGLDLELEDHAGAVHAAQRTGRRRLLVRRAGVAAASLAVAAAAVPLALNTARPPVQVYQPAAGAPAVVRASDVTLACSSANQGSVDGATPAKSPTDAARTWAKGSGFAQRYPDAQTSVLPGQQSLVVTLADSEGNVVAALEFHASDKGWSLSQLSYC